MTKSKLQNAWLARSRPACMIPLLCNWSRFSNSTGNMHGRSRYELSRVSKVSNLMSEHVCMVLPWYHFVTPKYPYAQHAFDNRASMNLANIATPLGASSSLDLLAPSACFSHFRARTKSLETPFSPLKKDVPSMRAAEPSPLLAASVR